MKTLTKSNIFILFLTFFIINFMIFQYIPNLYLNDYLNPYTLTFKNPKTLQMFNIIILYHYVMTFLIGVIIFTFIFIFLSFFRTYYFFNYKTFYKPQEFYSFSEFLAYFRKNLSILQFALAFNNIIDYFRFAIIKQKNYHLAFYKSDIKKSLNDQITHAPLLEFLWVIFPALILVVIAYPSIILLYYNEAYIEPVFNITVIGNQWFWTYEYNDFNLLKLFRNHINSDKTFFKKKFASIYFNFWSISTGFTTENDILEQKKIEQILTNIPRRVTVDCNMIIAKDPRFLRLLTTDQCLVIPAKTPIRFLITSADVIHSWAVPSYGIKIDAVPGRINQQILTVPLMGTSWGQCSELCGVNHAFMPIEIKVLAFSDFLYFMQLRVKEILLPFLVAYYKVKFDSFQRYIPLVREVTNKHLANINFKAKQLSTLNKVNFFLNTSLNIFNQINPYKNLISNIKLSPVYIINTATAQLNSFLDPKNILSYDLLKNTNLVNSLLLDYNNYPNKNIWNDLMKINVNDINTNINFTMPLFSESIIRKQKDFKFFNSPLFNFDNNTFIFTKKNIDLSNSIDNSIDNDVINKDNNIVNKINNIKNNNIINDIDINKNSNKCSNILSSFFSLYQKFNKSHFNFKHLNLDNDFNSFKVFPDNFVVSFFTKNANSFFKGDINTTRKNFLLSTHFFSDFLKKKETKYVIFDSLSGEKRIMNHPIIFPPLIKDSTYLYLEGSIEKLQKLFNSYDSKEIMKKLEKQDMFFNISLGLINSYNLSFESKYKLLSILYYKLQENPDILKKFTSYFFLEKNLIKEMWFNNAYKELRMYNFISNYDYLILFHQERNEIIRLRTLAKILAKKTQYYTFINNKK